MPPELKCQTGLFTFCVEISVKLSSESVQYTTEHIKRKITQPSQIFVYLFQVKAEKSSNIKEQNVENQNQIIGLEKNTFENGFLLFQ